MPEKSARTRQGAKAHDSEQASSHGSLTPSDKKELSLLKELQEDFRKEFTEMKKHFDDRFRELEERINTKLTEITCKYEHQIKTLETSLKKLERRNEELETRYRASDVVISGIPITPTEKVTDIFTKIVSKIGHQPSAFYEVFRIKKRNNKNLSGKAPPIVVKFASHVEKIHFIRCCKNFKLTLEDLGFTSDCPIYVTDSLTQRNRQLHYEARKLKKAGVVSKVMVKNGMVHVICSDNNTPVRIFDRDDLPTQPS